MKKVIAAIFTGMLLCGCAAQQPAVETTIPPAETSGIFWTAEESISEGAIKKYMLPESDYLGLISVQSDLLFFEGMDHTMLTLVSAGTGEVLAKAELNCRLLPEESQIQITQRNLGYYDSEDQSAVLLDSSLREVLRVKMPSNIQGPALWSDTLDEIYFCTAEEVRALNVQNNVARLLRSQKAQKLEMASTQFNSQILACSVTDLNGMQYMAFLSAQNGETIGRDEGLWNFASSGEKYVLQRLDGTVNEILFGTYGKGSKLLTPENNREQALPVLPMDGVVSKLENGPETILSFYQLSSGRKCSSVTLKNVNPGFGMCATDNQVWFLSEKEGEFSLYAWNPERNQTDDEIVYTGPRYTAENPDIFGMSKCEQVSDRLSQQYGVDILIGEEAVETGKMFTLEKEYQVLAIRQGLASLERALAAYPDGFLKKSAENTPSGTIHISLVRSIIDGHPGIQFWDENEAYIALAVGEGMEEAFYGEMNHIIDTYVIANCRAYDEWNELNPRLFSYDNNYTDYLNREQSPYLQGPDRAFLNSFAMTYPREDRAVLMEYAMSDGNTEEFESRYLQEKLKVMCMAIREAYRLDDVPEDFKWEQYLKDKEFLHENK